MDPKVVKLMDKLNITSLNDFKKPSTVTAVKDLRECYAKSTLEDYSWRLVRELKADESFPRRKITVYRKMWKEDGGQPKYKKTPTGNPTGRPPGVKNKCSGKENK
jgi:hypothetical protein